MTRHIARFTACKVQRGIRNLVRHLRGNGVAAILLDQYVHGGEPIDFLGHPVSEDGPAELVTTTTLQADELRKYRERFPAMRDADAFELR